MAIQQLIGLAYKAKLAACTKAAISGMLSDEEDGELEGLHDQINVIEGDWPTTLARYVAEACAQHPRHAEAILQLRNQISRAANAGGFDRRRLDEFDAALVKVEAASFQAAGSQTVDLSQCSAKEQDLAQAIIELWQGGAVWPGAAEIAQRFGDPVDSIRRELANMVKAGRLEKGLNGRGYRVVR
ncbi:MAG: hypothetical protein AAGB00_06275 [Planctomycetota bacterium]